MNPFLLTSVLFLSMAGLVALNSALVSFQILPWFNGLPWLRVHLITLGALTEAIFGILPALAGKRSSLEKPTPRWEIWLALTLGLLILMVGIPLVSYTLIVTGGTLVLAAALLMVGALRAPALALASSGKQPGPGRVFYLAGLAFLLLGIIVGSGLWFGWGQALGIANPLEVHIHTNLWGFTSLVFAGLLVDFYPRWTGRELAWPSSIRPIFWLMTLGALGAVLGPWLAFNGLMALGILMQQVATVWLLVNLVKPLRGAEITRKPGIWHLITAYFWQVMIVLAAPLVVFLQPGFSPSGLEQTAPQVLIYAWMMQFGYAVIPYLLRRLAAPGGKAELGGSWFSLATVHAGGVFLAASILLVDLSIPLLGVAYLLWFVSMLPIVHQSWQALQSAPAAL